MSHCKYCGKELWTAGCSTLGCPGSPGYVPESVDTLRADIARLTRDLEVSQQLCTDAIKGCDQQRERADEAERERDEALNLHSRTITGEDITRIIDERDALREALGNIRNRLCSQGCMCCSAIKADVDAALLAGRGEGADKKVKED